jgi:hypothetical protein
MIWFVPNFHYFVRKKNGKICFKKVVECVVSEINCKMDGNHTLGGHD